VGLGCMFPASAMQPWQKYNATMDRASDADAPPPCVLPAAAVTAEWVRATGLRCPAVVRGAAGSLGTLGIRLPRAGLASVADLAKLLGASYQVQVNNRNSCAQEAYRFSLYVNQSGVDFKCPYSNRPLKPLTPLT
jgi:hypothetical protein